MEGNETRKDISLLPNATPIEENVERTTEASGSASSRWAIIYCPKQGAGRSQKRWEHIQELLEEQHVAYDFVQSEGPESVERLTKMLCLNGYETLIIMGGDSALNRALNGLLSLDDAIRQRVALGVIPNGRGNDFATFWGFTENDDAQTVTWLVKRRLRRVDVGLVRGGSELQLQRYFLNCVNVGLVANIMKLKYKTRRIFGLSALAYFVSMILLLFQRLETRMKLRINEETIERKLMTVCVGNGRGYGQTPSAVPYNGMLDITVVSHPEVRQLLEGLWMLFTGKFLNHKNVRAYRSPRPIRFMSIKGATVSADGMVLSGFTERLNISLLPEHVDFIIPS